MPISTMDHNFHMSKLRNFRSSVLKLQPSFRNLLVRDWRVEINAYMEEIFFFCKPTNIGGGGQIWVCMIY